MASENVDQLPADVVSIAKASERFGVYWEMIKRWADSGVIRSWSRPGGKVILVSLEEVEKMAQWQLRQQRVGDERAS